MNSKFYKDHLSKFSNKLINDFDPKISNNFEKDKIIYSNSFDISDYSNIF